VFPSMAHQTHLNLCKKASLHSHHSLNHRKQKEKKNDFIQELKYSRRQYKLFVRE
jgi:hypothetical protein